MAGVGKLLKQAQKMQKDTDEHILGIQRAAFLKQECPLGVFYIFIYIYIYIYVYINIYIYIYIYILAP